MPSNELKKFLGFSIFKGKIDHLQIYLFLRFEFFSSLFCSNAIDKQNKARSALTKVKMAQENMREVCFRLGF